VGEVIHGPIAEEVTEEEAERMNHDFMFKAAFATLKETTVTTRSGKKKPSFELIRLVLIKEEPPVKAVAPARPATPPKELPPTPAGPTTKAVRPKLPEKVPPAIETKPAKAHAPTPPEPTTPVTPPPVQKKTPPKTEPPPSEPDKK